MQGKEKQDKDWLLHFKSAKFRKQSDGSSDSRLGHLNNEFLSLVLSGNSDDFNLSLQQQAARDTEL